MRAGARVVVGEPLDHRLERDDARGRDHAGLAHAAAEPAPLHAGLGDHVGRAAQQRADRRAQALRQAEHHGVGAADQLARAASRSRSPRSRCARRRRARAARPSCASPTSVRISSAPVGAPDIAM